MEISKIVALASYKTQQVEPVKNQQAIVVIYPRARPEERQAQTIVDIVTISAEARDLYAISMLGKESRESESVVKIE
jgi:hypothetical protein